MFFIYLSFIFTIFYLIYCHMLGSCSTTW